MSSIIIVLLVLVVFLLTSLLGIIFFIWIQLNDNYSRLTKHIENRIRLYNINNNIRGSEEIIEEE